MTQFELNNWLSLPTGIPNNFLSVNATQPYEGLCQQWKENEREKVSKFHLGYAVVRGHVTGPLR